MIITVFAVVVIGGMGSTWAQLLPVSCSVWSKGFTKVVYAPASSTVIFLIMVIVLLMTLLGGGLSESWADC